MKNMLLIALAGVTVLALSGCFGYGHDSWTHMGEGYHHSGHRFIEDHDAPGPNRAQDPCPENRRGEPGPKENCNPDR